MLFGGEEIMKRWLQKNIWWIGLVIMLAIALFPKAFAIGGNLLIKYLPVYWLPGSIVLIVVLLSMILKRLGDRKDNYDT